MRTLMLAAATAALLVQPAMAQERSQASGTILNVNATGTVTTPPDMATVTVGVENEAVLADAALRENSRRMAALIQALRRAGVAEPDIRTSRMSLRENWSNSRKIGYTASNTVQAKVRDIDNVGAVIDAAVAAGGNQVQGVSFGLQDPTPHLDQARRDAARVGRERGELYADALGMRVERVISVTEQGAAPAQRFEDEIVVTASRAGGYTPTPIQSGELETRASVSISFLLR